MPRKIPLSKGFFTIPIRQRILHYSSHRGYLYYSNPTTDSLLFLSQRISLLFQSDKGFFTVPLSEDFFTIPIRQRILHYHFLKGFLYYSNPTADSLLFLSQRIALLFQSDKGFVTIIFSKDFFTTPIRQRILYCSSLNIFLYYSSPTKDCFIFWEHDKNTCSSFEQTE